MKFKKETIIGLVVVLSLTVLVWGINFLKGHDVFTKERTFFAQYERVDGLKTSSPVTLKGFKIGQIKRIFFNSDEGMTLYVEFSVDPAFKFPKNSVARIISSDIMGTKEINIIPGDSKEYLQAGDTLSGSIEGDLKEQVSMQVLPLKTKAERLLSSVDSVLVVIQSIFDKNTRDNLSKSIASIRLTIQNLESTSGTLDTLVTGQRGRLESIFANIDSISYNLKSNNEHISNILANFSTISDSLSDAHIATTILEANKAMVKVNNILTKVNAGEGSAGALINNDTLYRNLESASSSLNELLVDLKKNPKKYVRFSLFDFGRTTYQEADKTRKQKDKEQGVSYRIQILSSPTPIPLDDKTFKNYKNITELHQDNLYKYLIGDTNNYREIIRLLKKVKRDFPDAFLVRLTPEGN